MKKRNILAVLGLYFITLGIYTIYWLYKTRLDLVARAQNPKSIPPVIVLFIPLFVMIPLLLIIAIPLSNSSGGEFILVAAVILAMVASLAVSLWWYYHYCKVASAITHGIDSTSSYVIWIATTFFSVPFVWMMIVQNDMNKFLDQEAMHSGGHVPQQPTVGMPTATPPATV